MANTKQAGFTLIELILVMAITGTLALIAFVGQGALRSQAQFDASVNKVVASVANARNAALTAVNLKGDGAGNSLAGSVGCDIENQIWGYASPGPAGGTYVYAGTKWYANNEFVPSHSSIVAIYDYKASKDAPNACDFDSQFVSFPSPLHVNTTAASGHQGAKVAFARTDNGGLVVCALDLQADNRPDFINGACDPSTSLPFPLTLTFSDDSGHSATVQIDDTGTAKRIN